MEDFNFLQNELRPLGSAPKNVLFAVTSIEGLSSNHGNTDVTGHQRNTELILSPSLRTKGDKKTAEDYSP